MTGVNKPREGKGAEGKRLVERNRRKRKGGRGGEKEEQKEKRERREYM